MWRYLVGAVAALLLTGGGLMLWRGGADARQAIPPAPAAGAVAAEGEAVPAMPPQASERTREEKRFARYDKDRDGKVARDEYLAARRKAYARLDRNGDGRLDFEEYAVKTGEKFAKADADRSGTLTAGEFAATRVVRRAKPRVVCPPATAREDDEG